MRPFCFGLSRDEQLAAFYLLFDACVCTP